MENLFLKLTELGQISINSRHTGYYINNPYRLSREEFEGLQALASQYNIKLERTYKDTVYNGYTIPPRISIYSTNNRSDETVTFFNDLIAYQLNRDSESIEKIDYAEMLQAINNELRWISKRPKTISLNNGVRSEENQNIFIFNITANQYKQIKHVDECIVIYQDNKYEGNVTGKNNKNLKLYLKNGSLPSELDTINLEWIASTTYEFMKKRILENRTISDLEQKLLFPNNETIETDDISIIYDKDLTNKNQQKTVLNSLKNKISYVWGPPGTGKTTTIMQTASNLIKDSKRVLFVSNANRAVDLGVIEIIDNLNKNFSDSINIDETITRYGSPFIDNNSELNDVFFDNQIIAKKEELIAKIKPIIDKRKKYKLLNDKLSILIKTKKNIDEIKKAIRTFKEEIKNKEIERKKYINPESSLVIAAKKIFNTKLNEDLISEIDDEILNLKQGLERRYEDLEVFKKNNAIAKNKIDLDEYDKLKKWIEEKFGSESDLDDFIVKETSVDIEKELQSKLFVAATISKVITNNVLYNDNKFDTLIVDEASMIGITPILILSKLINQNIIIAGDPRQLPPIIQNDDSLISKKWMGTDIFNIVGKEENLLIWHQTNPDFTFFLNEQYRMRPLLGDFISRNFYDRKLISKKDESDNEPYLFFANTINSQIGEWKGETGLNVYNITHVEKIIDLLHLIFNGSVIVNDTGLPVTNENVGIITPINSSAKYIRQELDKIDDFNEIEVGTIHTFQGREKEIIIFDTVMGGNLNYTIRPYDQFKTGDNVKKLLNVAFSRTKNKLFIVSDMNYFEKYYTNINGNQFIYNCFKDFQSIAENL